MIVRKPAALSRLTALLALAAAPALNGCATVTAGTTQDIRIASDPAGAECRIQRDGMAVAVVTTPGKANVPRSRKDLSVTCSKSGLQDATQIIPSAAHAGTVGNIIAGGLIGVAVDAASGANYNYLELTVVSLAPPSFDSAASRDLYYNEQRTRVSAVVDGEAKRVMDSCPQSKREFCTIEVQRLDEARVAALTALEQKRQAAVIAAR